MVKGEYLLVYEIITHLSWTLAASRLNDGTTSKTLARHVVPASRVSLNSAYSLGCSYNNIIILHVLNSQCHSRRHPRPQRSANSGDAKLTLSQGVQSSSCVMRQDRYKS